MSEILETDVEQKIRVSLRQSGVAAGSSTPKMIRVARPRVRIHKVSERGPQGWRGHRGKRGPGWYSGSGIPNDGEHANGDFYLDSDTGDYYKKIDNFWVLQGGITGSTPMIEQSTSLALGLSESGNTYTVPIENEIVFTLPLMGGLNGGETYRFVKTIEASQITIQLPSFDSSFRIFRFPNDIGEWAVSTAPDGLGIGASITLVCVKGSGWYAKEIAGTWSI